MPPRRLEQRFGGQARLGVGAAGGAFEGLGGRFLGAVPLAQAQRAVREVQVRPWDGMLGGAAEQLNTCRTCTGVITSVLTVVDLDRWRLPIGTGVVLVFARLVLR